jgi:glycerol-3-phosphate dehydrogenase
LQKQLNTNYYKNQKLIKKPDVASLDISEILNQKPNFFILAVPSVYIKSTLKQLISQLKYKAYFINVSKGLDPDTNNI